MSRLDLVGGSYFARSAIANAQRCINYYPERNRVDSPVPFTYYQRPGLRPLVQGPAQPVREVWRASDGQGFCVIGQKCYYIDPAWALVELGTLTFNAMTPVRFADNGVTVVLVDGSTTGYSIDLATHAFAPIVDATGTFTGATAFAYIDTFLIWNYPGTKVFGSTLSNTVSFNALYISAKTAFPDPLIYPVVNRNEIILLGALKSEIWYDAGAPQFPFAKLPGAYIEHGCVAPYSVATADIETFWLSQDLQGARMVLALKGYDTRRVSNHALEFALSQMANVSDAIGFTYQQEGHVYYVLTLPTGNQTWVFDTSLEDDPTMAWHQRAFTPVEGQYDRWRANCGAFIYGQNVVGDYANGTLYAQDKSQYFDRVDGVDYRIGCVKGFPHIVQGWDERSAQAVLASGKLVQHRMFQLDLEVGSVPLDADGNAQSIWLRWSDTKGLSWEQAVLQTVGAPGVYETSPLWRGIGIARDRVYEIAHSLNGPAALNSAWVDGTVLAN